MTRTRKQQAPPAVIGNLSDASLMDCLTHAVVMEVAHVVAFDVQIPRPGDQYRAEKTSINFRLELDYTFPVPGFHDVSMDLEHAQVMLAYWTEQVRQLKRKEKKS